MNKCISITTFFYHHINNGPIIRILPVILNRSSASCFFISFDFSLSHTGHLDGIIILPFFVLTSSGFLLFFIFSILQAIK